MKLKNKIAVITGAGRGIGESVARVLADQGADLVLAARTSRQLERVADDIRVTGRNAVSMTCDVSSPTEVKRLAANAIEEFGKIDILVNNAGISKRSKLLDYDDDTWLEVIRVNLFGVYLCSKAFLPVMQQTGEGRIINVASTAGKTPVPFNSAYSASKHGVLGFTKSIASEVALSGYPGITVNAICPFFVETDMFRGSGGYLDQMSKMAGVSKDQLQNKVLGRSLQQRALEPGEVAAMTLYLASDEARGVTGQAFNICGGSVFH